MSNKLHLNLLLNEGLMHSFKDSKTKLGGGSSGGNGANLEATRKNYPDQYRKIQARHAANRVAANKKRMSQGYAPVNDDVSYEEDLTFAICESIEDSGFEVDWGIIDSVAHTVCSIDESEMSDNDFATSIVEGLVEDGHEIDEGIFSRLWGAAKGAIKGAKAGHDEAKGNERVLGTVGARFVQRKNVDKLKAASLQNSKDNVRHGNVTRANQRSGNARAIGNAVANRMAKTKPKRKPARRASGGAAAKGEKAAVATTESYINRISLDRR